MQDVNLLLIEPQGIEIILNALQADSAATFNRTTRN